jgi:ferredoxin
MALMITEDCINCAACASDCPSGAIDQGDDHYEIDPKLCDECKTLNEEPYCVSVCPVADDAFKLSAG